MFEELGIEDEYATCGYNILSTAYFKNKYHYDVSSNETIKEYALKVRSDPDLIKAIEKIGTIESSGRDSYLKIIEVPNDAKIELAHYDGWERIEEIHRIWS